MPNWGSWPVMERLPCGGYLQMSTADSASAVRHTWGQYVLCSFGVHQSTGVPRGPTPAASRQILDQLKREKTTQPKQPHDQHGVLRPGKGKQGENWHTSTADMRKDDPHGPAVQHALHEPVAALMRHPDERRDARQQTGRAQATGLVERQRRVLEVDEEGVEAGGARDLHHRRRGHDFDAECLEHKVRQCFQQGEFEQVKRSRG